MTTDITPETGKTYEIPLRNLYPTASLSENTRSILDHNLKDWLKRVETIKNHNKDEADAVRELIRQYIITLDHYNGFDESYLIQPKAENQDSFLKEWHHQVRSYILRTNSVKGKDNLFDTSDYSDFPNLDQFQKLNNDQRSEWFLRTFSGFIQTLAEEQDKRLVHSSQDTVKWFDQEENTYTDITLMDLIQKTSNHESQHNGEQKTHLLSQGKKVSPMWPAPSIRAQLQT